jgi:uncharacterized protein
LRIALDSAKLGDPEKLNGFRRLEKFARTIEQRYAPQADFDATLDHEITISKELGGRSVFNDLKMKSNSAQSKRQLSLFKNESI